MRGGQEHKLYETCVQINAQTVKVRNMMRRSVSREAIRDQQETLKNLNSMKEYVTSYVDYDGVFRLFNGSLVASFLASYGLLDREIPAPYRYVPQDFAHDPPFKSATTLEEPVVFFKD
ncbi:hypothetical protein AGDE_12147 [Angomonas deanei]|nr:hypothetical protein AGDE_12147 [Angomonas deanei]|eukprot:EPY24837.1 hypothetical protein AGDE_12147 [Angomonas deanei]